MSRLVSQVLQSSHFVQEEKDATAGCVCCGVRHPGSAAHCQRCYAPLQLSHSVKSRGTPPRFVAILGASGAGKTVYLGTLLDILSHGYRGIRGVPNGTFSLEVQEETMTALGNRCFPEKTASEADGWQWVHCEVTQDRKPRQPVDLVTPDFAGEAITHEMDQPGTYPAVQSIVGKAQGLLVLCDAIASGSRPLNEDIFAMKLASYVHSTREAQTSGRSKRKVNVPMAVVFTKSDQCPEVRDDPEGFAANHLSRFYRFCERNFSQFRCFASSVVGCCTTQIDNSGCRSQIAWHVEPHGVTEPLEWIIQHG